MDRAQIVQAALFDFIAQRNEDRARGLSLPLSAYLERFPECEQEIAIEFLRDAPEPTAPARAGVNHASFRERNPPAERYRAIREIARGGMGRILRVRDASLGRDVAMKTSLEGRPGSRARLVEEAHVTGQLDHPGVVPVHDLGEDARGHSFFTMRLVEGRDLREIIGMVHRREDGWSVTRALEVLLKVCDTLAFAHSRGVVHRDLKPSNIRVGSYGEVYVLDWGLAKSSQRAEASGGERADDLLDRRAPVLTLDGDVIGTPCTMSPEQAEGRVYEVGPRSDVYSAGAMLYEILSGRMPFLVEGETPTSATVLERVRRGALTPLKELCPKAPPELVSICEKAMARDPAARYPDMREMASDLRAFLEQRVVRAHARGAWPELVKWVRRNRWLAVAIASVVVISTAAAIYATVLRHRNERRLRLVADSRSPRQLVDRFHEIRPDVPERIPEMERWLADADDVLSRRDAYRSELAELQSVALPWNPNDVREVAAEKERQRKLADFTRLRDFYLAQEQKLLREGGLSDEDLTLEEVRSQLASARLNLETYAPKPEPRRLTWRFADEELQFRYDTIEAMLPELEPLIGTPAGPDRPAEEGLFSRMRRRLEFTRGVEAVTLERARGLWDEAIASIRNEKECPAYKGLVIGPQIGLVPIRRDPASGLWEFLHVETGVAPRVGADGRYAISEETGIVLVLVPGAPFDMGAQNARPDLPNFDPGATPDEWSTRHEHPEAVRILGLDPYFLSKYEMTQSQWERITGWNDAAFTARLSPRLVRSGTHPIENVSWEKSLEVVRQVGLSLPTEAQWEFGARGGTVTPWWTGADRASLEEAANLADRRLDLEKKGQDSEAKDWPELDDGYAIHAPVGSFRANPYGLHDVCGNVSEWCSDAGATSYGLIVITTRIGTYERIHLDEGVRVHRGGSFASRAAMCRSSARAFNGPAKKSDAIGVRPSRELDR